MADGESCQRFCCCYCSYSRYDYYLELIRDRLDIWNLEWQPLDSFVSVPIIPMSLSYLRLSYYYYCYYKYSHPKALDHDRVFHSYVERHVVDYYLPHDTNSRYYCLKFLQFAGDVVAVDESK